MNPEERSQYLMRRFHEANKRANSAIAEAKKAKERLITSIRMMQAVKAERDQFEDMLDRIGEAYSYAPTQHEFNHEVYAILEERNRD